MNDVYFLNNSSVGLYPAVVTLREKLQSAGYGKWWAATISSLRIMARFRRLHLELKLTDGRVLIRKTPMLFVGNNAYSTDAANIGTRESLQTGLLWVTLSTSSGPLGFIKSFLALVSGTQAMADAISLDATSVQVNSSKELLAVATDGEVVKLKTPLNYKILPRALRVLVPIKRD